MALPKPKTRTEFFALERATWNKLLALTKGLPRTAWMEPNTLGKWSLKDVYAHLADWMIETRDRIPKILCEEKLPHLSITKLNHTHHQQNQTLTTAQARQRATRERKALLRLLQTLSEEELLRHKDVYTWAGWATFNHYANHIPNIARFRRAVLRRAK